MTIILKRKKSMGKAPWDIEHLIIQSAQFNHEMLRISIGFFPDIDNNVQYCASETSDQLGLLRIIRLEVYTPYCIAFKRNGDIGLDHLVFQAMFPEFFRTECSG